MMNNEGKLPHLYIHTFISIRRRNSTIAVPIEGQDPSE